MAYVYEVYRVFANGMLFETNVSISVNSRKYVYCKYYQLVIV